MLQTVGNNMSTELTKPTKSFSLNPASLKEAIELSELMAKSDLVPKDYKGKAGNILVAVQMGAEIGLPAMQSIQNIAVINGKPSIYGDLGKALLLSAGIDIDEDDVDIVKKNSKARCKISRPGRTPCERTFSLEDAQKAGLWNKEGPWKTYPYRQMMWRAFWFAARDGAADILKGLGGAEELMDFPARDMGGAEVVERAPLAEGDTGQTVEPEPKQPAQKPPYPADQFKAKLAEWKKLVVEGGKKPETIISTIGSKYTLTNEQHNTITNIATLKIEGEQK